MERFVIDINLNEQVKETKETSTPSKQTVQAQKIIKGMGVAAAWKGVNTMVQLQNYTSGDQVANQQRAMAMRMASYGTMLALAGPKAPLVAVGIAINEGINAGTDLYKYNFDRRMERSALLNAEMVVGDITYGRRGGAR